MSISLAESIEKMKQQISDLEAKVHEINSCNCERITLIKNQDGSYTLTQGDKSVTFRGR